MIKSRRIGWVGHVVHMGDRRRSVCRLLVGRPEERSLLRRPLHRWEYYVTINLLEVDVETWSGLMWLRIGICGERRLVYTVMKTFTWRMENILLCDDYVFKLTPNFFDDRLKQTVILYLGKYHLHFFFGVQCISISKINSVTTSLIWFFVRYFIWVFITC